MTEKPIPPTSLDEIMYRIRQEVEQRNPESKNNSYTNSSSILHSELSHHVDRHSSLLLPEHDNRIEQKSTYLLSDFFKYHDEDFIINAYYGILRRPPDKKGLNDFLSAYRDGRLSKLEILGRLRFSKEGRNHRVRVQGLLPRFAVRTSCHVPVLGYLIALGAALARLPIILKQLQQFEAFTVARQQQQIQSINASAQQLTEHQHSLQSLDTTKADLAATKAEIIELRSMLSTVEQTLLSIVGRKADASAAEELERALAALTERIAAIDRALARKAEIAAVVELRDALAVLDARLNATDRAMQATDQAIQAMEAHTRTELGATSAALGDLAAMLTDKANNRELIDVTRQLADHKRNILDQERRLTLLLEEARKRLPEPLQLTQIERMVSEEEHLMDSFYISFEDRFRGTREDIKNRLAIYIPLVKDARAATAFAPALDLGCGRGEWLEILREQEITSRGVDLNHSMLAQCHANGLDVTQADAVDYLRSLARDSLSAVTAMHLVEHIPFRRVVVLLDEVLRVLKPGGVAIFETPNPENLVVGACNFYLDPTHLNPIPPQTLQYIVEARGFVRSRIERLNVAVLNNPFIGLHQLTQMEDVQLMRKLLEDTYFGPPDYALIAYKA